MRRNQTEHAGNVSIGEAGALQHAGEAIASTQGSGKFDTGPFWRGGQRDDGGARHHMATVISPKGKRAQALNAQFIASLVIQHGHRCCLQRGETGPQHECGTAKPQHGAKPAKPACTADILGQIRHQILFGKPALNPCMHALWTWGAQRCRGFGFGRAQRFGHTRRRRTQAKALRRAGPGKGQHLISRCEHVASCTLSRSALHVQG